jgi:hypothetical protein
MKHSGESNEFTLPFYHDDSSTMDIIETLVTTIVDEGASTKFIYQLGTELERIAKSDAPELKREVFCIETKRMLERSEIKKSVADVLYEKIELLTKQINEFDLSNMLMFLRAIAFIARERGAGR